MFGKYGTLTNARGWPIHHHDMAVALGLNPNSHLPEAMGLQFINGVYVWIDLPHRHTDGRKSSQHRVMCHCPGCNRMLSAGRLAQHQKACGEWQQLAPDYKEAV